MNRIALLLLLLAAPALHASDLRTAGLNYSPTSRW
jgi:hypothetical protein